MLPSDNAREKFAKSAGHFNTDGLQEQQSFFARNCRKGRSFYSRSRSRIRPYGPVRTMSTDSACFISPTKSNGAVQRKCTHCCEIFSGGIYKCRWKSSDSENQWTALAEKCWWWAFLFIFIFLVTIFFCWSVFSNDYDDFNWFIYTNAGIWFGWGVLILSVFFILLFYIVLLLCSGIVLIANGEKRHLHLCHKISIIVVMLLCVCAYVAVSQLWNEEFYSVVLALKMTAPWLHISLLFIVLASSWLMFYEIMRIERFVLWILANVGVLILFFCVFFIPLFISSPCIGPAPGVDSIPKPLIIAHRLGDVKHAPENTILAFQEGVKKCSSFAVETDVSISMDGVAFLMHDNDNIQRTTNVASVFPDKANQRAEFFTWAELQQLDAGSWFLEKDPFRTAGSLSSEFKDQIKAQKIPKLDQMVGILGDRSIIFDLYQPSYPNPFRNNFTDVALKALIDSGMLSENQILWLPGYDRNSIRAQAPGIRMVATNNGIDFFQMNNISIVNLGYLEHTPESIANYVQNNISVIQYRIEAPWLFSYAWCQGTAMVTTNSCERLSSISNPIWTLSKEGYSALWVCMDLLVLLCLIVIFCIQYYRSECSYLPCFTYRKIGNAMTGGCIDNISLELR